MFTFKRSIAAVGALAMLAAAAPDLGTPVAGVAADLGSRCAVGSPAEAGVSLLGMNTELVEANEHSALMLTPLFAPATRARLLAADANTWCDASALNLVKAGATDIELITTAVTTLATANFDGVSVRDVALARPGVYTATTHAMTNGVVADWTVEVDTLGIASATWTATGFAVAPFTAEAEGLTALPGATMTYDRDAAGFLNPTIDFAQLAESEREGDPSPFITVEGPDGFTMHVEIGDALSVPVTANTLARPGACISSICVGNGLPTVYGGPAPDPGIDSGDVQVDFYRVMGEGLDINYTDFNAWGLQKGWLDDEGSLYVDGALAAYCLACVLVSDYFNIHMSRAISPALGALGYSYPDDRDALIDIVGHELFHNFQNAYGKPGSLGGGRNAAYSEGTARFQESLHSYSEVSHQPNSLLYANDTNGCNGWQGNNANTAFAAGPLTAQSYDACYFWMTYYAAYGMDGLVALFDNSAQLPSGRGWQIYAPALTAAISEVDVDASLGSMLANFAAMSLTGNGYVWGAPNDPDAPELDWAKYLDLWNPNADAYAGITLNATLRDGGIRAAVLRNDVSIATIVGGEAAAVYEIDGVTTTRMLAVGDIVEMPVDGRAWIVIMNPTTSNESVSVQLAKAA